MPRKSIRYGFKIALKSDQHKGFILATNNVLLPLGVLPESSDKLRFENAIFQIVTGDGEPSSDLTQRRVGEEIKFGQTIRLIHATTNTLVCESKRSRATKEKANQKVILAPVNSEEARASKWRIMPRYKVRSEGEKVCDRDIIVLHSISGDTNIHIAAASDSFTDNFFEVNASVTATGITLQAYDTESYDPESQAREIRGGDCLQLFHKEERAYLVGDKDKKCFLDPEGPQAQLGKSVNETGNSNSMFVVEFDDLFAGGLVTFGRKRTYRLKSLSTGAYLCARIKPPTGGSSGTFSLPKVPFGVGEHSVSETEATEIESADTVENTLIDDSIQVYLCEDNKDPGTCICFHQATDDASATAKNHCRVFVEFPRIKDGVWLSAGQIIQQIVRRRSSMLPKGEMDFSRPKKEIACGNAVSHKDGLEVIKVDSTDFQELNAVLALVPPIQRLVNELNAGKLPSVQLLAQVRENIILLAKNCTISGEEDILRREGNPVATAQNRLLDQHIPQLCIDVVKAVLNGKTPVSVDNIHELAVIPEAENAEGSAPGTLALKYSDFLHLVRVSFRCIRQASLRNIRVATALSDEIEAIYPYISYSFGAMSCLREIFRDNPRLVDNPDDLKIVSRFAENAVAAKRSSPDFIRFLPLLCSCRGIGMRNAQSMISDEIFEVSSAAREEITEESLCFTVWLEGGKLRINTSPSMPVSSIRKSRNPETPTTNHSLNGEGGAAKFGMDFEEFCLEADNRVVSSRSSMASFTKSSSGGGGGASEVLPNSPYGVFLAQMELFIGLCRGRHSANIAKCHQFVPPNTVLRVIENSNLPSSVRSLFFQYFEVSIVDVNPMDDVVEQVRSLVKVWDKIGTANDIIMVNRSADLQEEQRGVIEEVKTFIKSFLIESASMDPGDLSQNHAVSSAVQCVSTLARFGLINVEEFVDWIKALTPVLDGRDDKIPVVDERYMRRFGKYSRFRYDEDNHTMMEVKVRCMEVVSIFVDVFKARKVSDLLRDFKQGKETPHFSTILDFNLDSKLDEESEELLKKKKEALEKAEAGLLMGGLGMITDGLGSGLDAMKAVGNMALSVIPGMDKPEEKPTDYLNYLIDTLLDNTAYEYMPVVVASAGLIVDILNVHSAIVAPMDRVQILSSANGVEYFERSHPTFRQLSGYVGLTIPRTEMKGVTEQLEALSDSLQEGASKVPDTNRLNTERQAILQNMGMHKVVTEIAASFANSDVNATFPTSVTDMLSACYRFLGLMVLHSHEIALDVFPFLEELVKHLVLHVGVENLMLVMFDNNLDLCSSVSDNFLQDLVYALPRVQFDPLVAHIVHMLIYQPGTVGAIPRNQQSVLKLLLEAEESMPGFVRSRDFFTGAAGRQNRAQLLDSDEYLRPMSRIQYHCEIISILAHCSRNRDSSKKMDIRSAVFGSSTGVEDILEVLCNRKKLPTFFRSVYARLFTELYVEDRSMRQTLADNKHFLRFLGHAHDDIMSVEFKLQEAVGAEENPFPVNYQTQSPGGNGDTDDNWAQKPPLYRQSYSSEVDLNFAFECLVPMLRGIFNAFFGEHALDDGEDPFRDGDEEGGLLDKLKDLAEICSSMFMNLSTCHPFSEKTADEVPGTVKEEEKKKTSSFLPFSLPFGKKDEEEDKPEPVVLTAMQRMVPDFLRGGRDFYFAQQVSENVPGHEHDSAKNVRIIDLPFIPVSSLKVLKNVVAFSMTIPDLKESDLDIETACKQVEGISYVPGKEDATEAVELTPDAQIFNAWKEFRDKYKEIDQLQDDNAFAAAGVLVLRKSKLGHDTVRNLCRILDNPMLTNELRISILYLLRQVIVVEDEEFSDASLLIKETDELDEPDENRKIEILATMLTLDKAQAARQNILATWTGDYALAPKIVELVSGDNRTLLLATLHCGSALLADGNKKVQTQMLKWSQDRADEVFFIETRVKFLTAKDKLRDRKRAIKREIPDKQARLQKLPDDLHNRLNRRFNFDVSLALMGSVQLMCEGHFIDMQNYMRQQDDNQISINVLESITGLLEMLAKAVDRTTFELAKQTLATMTELIQGPCFGNQEFFTSQNVGEVVTKLIGTEYGDCTEDQLYELRMGSVTLLLSLFEGHMNTQLVTTLIQSLSYQVLVDLMDKTYEAWLESRGEGGDGNILSKGLDVGKDLAKGLLFGLGDEDEFTDKCNLACNIFIFLKATLDIQQLTIGRDADLEFDQFVDRDGITVKDAFRSSRTYKKLSKKVSTVEIARNSTVEKAYFRKPQVSAMNLKESSKDNLIKDVERGGDNARLKDFFDRSFNLIREMEYYEDMRKTPGLSIIHKYSDWFDAFSLLIAFGMNIFLISVVQYENETKSGVMTGTQEDAYDGIGIAIIVLQCLLFVNFFFGPCRIHLNEKWMEWQDAHNEKAIKESKASLSIEPPRVDPEYVQKLPFPIRIGVSVLMIFTWYPFYQRGLFIVTAVLGYVYSPVWYCVQLFQIIEKSAQLQNVVLSVTQNGRNLVLTGCLLMVVVYTFAVIAYYNYSHYFIPDLMGIGGNCDSLAKCTMMMLVNGLKAGGGIGDVLDFPLYGRVSEGYLRLLFDFMFFLLLIVIFLNIVFGIILDTFGELRGIRDFVETDQKEKCFICGLARADFDRVAPGGFEQHFMYEHHMWDYLFYMHYVKLKPTDEHNGSEGFVADCMESLEPNFFPIAKAMILDNCNDEEDQAEAVRKEAATVEKQEKAKEDDDTMDKVDLNASITGANVSRSDKELEELRNRMMRMEALLTKIAENKK